MACRTVEAESLASDRFYCSASKRPQHYTCPCSGVCLCVSGKLLVSVLQPKKQDLTADQILIRTNKTGGRQHSVKMVKTLCSKNLLHSLKTWKIVSDRPQDRHTLETLQFKTEIKALAVMAPCRTFQRRCPVQLEVWSPLWTMSCDSVCSHCGCSLNRPISLIFFSMLE